MFSLWSYPVLRIRISFSNSDPNPAQWFKADPDPEQCSYSIVVIKAEENQENLLIVQEIS
jgi:hypothetical protein